MDYTSTHPNATICYHASNMILTTDTDADQLILPEAHIHITGYYYFKNRMLEYYKSTPTTNVPILTEYKTPKTVVSSSAEAGKCGTFENAQNIIPL